MRSRVLVLYPPFVAAIAAVAPIRAQDDLASLVSPSHEAAIERGLAWLDRAQLDDGSWGTSELWGGRAFLASQACLAYLAAGSTPQRGPHAPALSEGLRFVLASADEDGCLGTDVRYGIAFEHAAATLLLVEASAWAAQREQVLAALAKALEWLARQQQDDGGWIGPSAQPSSVPATTMALLALHAARTAGYHPRADLLRALAFIDDTYWRWVEDAGVWLARGGPDFDAAAAALALLPRWKADAAKIDLALDWVVLTRPASDHGVVAPFALPRALLREGDRFETWYLDRARALLEQELLGGGWSAWGSDPGNIVLSTSLAILILESPRLPLWVHRFED